MNQEVDVNAQRAAVRWPRSADRMCACARRGGEKMPSADTFPVWRRAAAVRCVDWASALCCGGTREAWCLWPTPNTPSWIRWEAHSSHYYHQPGAIMQRKLPASQITNAVDPGSAGFLMSAVPLRWSPTRGPYPEACTPGRSSSSRALWPLMLTGNTPTRSVTNAVKPLARRHERQAKIGPV